MLTDKIAELDQIEAKARTLRQEIDKELPAVLRALPAQVGLKTIPELIAVLQKVQRAQPPKPATNGAEGPRKSRVKVTPEIQAKIRELTEQKKTDAEIGELTGISKFSVLAWRKKMGLKKGAQSQS